MEKLDAVGIGGLVDMDWSRGSVGEWVECVGVFSGEDDCGGGGIEIDCWFDFDCKRWVSCGEVEEKKEFCVEM